MPDFEIVTYDPQFKRAFHDLNIAWLEHYFTVEPVHRKTLENPEREILTGGGEIFFGVMVGEAVGTVAVRHAGNGVYELTKLGVDPKAQGSGMGRVLCERVIDYFKDKSGTLLYLETHAKLKAAMHLYKELGFKVKPHAGEGQYQGCDLYLEWEDGR